MGENDLYTGGKDGNIIHWDLSSDLALNDLSNTNSISCGLKDGFDSVQFNGKANALEAKLNQRQCGTVLPASNSNIVSMCSIKTEDDADTKIMSIDGSSFLGVHNKISESFNVNINTNKLYYTEEDIQLLIQSEISNSCGISNDTLVGDLQNYSTDSLVKPLTISRKPTAITTPIPIKSSHSPSNSIGTTVLFPFIIIPMILWSIAQLNRFLPLLKVMMNSHLILQNQEMKDILLCQVCPPIEVK